jgi:hypothetical protein
VLKRRLLDDGRIQHQIRLVKCKQYYTIINKHKIFAFNTPKKNSVGVGAAVKLFHCLRKMFCCDRKKRKKRKIKKKSVCEKFFEICSCDSQYIFYSNPVFNTHKMIPLAALQFLFIQIQFYRIFVYKKSYCKKFIVTYISTPLTELFFFCLAHRVTQID